jgi:AcrR family transcriptional regulator
MAAGERTPEPEHDDRVLRLRHGTGRQALLEAVVRVVARDGFDGLTYRAVAAEAGVTHGLVHYHFGSREAMIDETTHWAVAEAMRGSIDVLMGSDVLEDLGVGLGALVSAHRDAQVFQNELLLTACRRPELRPHLDELFAAYWSGIERTLAAAGVEPRPPLVRLVFAAMNGLVLQQLYFGSPEATTESMAELRHMLRAARRRQSSGRR